MSVFDIETLLSQMTQQLKQRLTDTPNVGVIGIHTGGAWLAQRLHTQLGISEPLGLLDITFYRDDFSTIGLHPQVRSSSLPFEVEDKHIVLIDDVFKSGRTVRAALNEIFDYGRPASVTLAVLVDLQAHELPIHPDVIGTTMQLESDKRIKLLGPDHLELVIQDAPRR